ncbi:MAG: hypothetical protein H6574_13580 [Lewinellaceae bacterium]|nr:hypothetical protein [Saprospiraceae bacterium]MCB9316872.1 hypothetical protein [Lewinellaceae bacterium]MCB9332108.1 hypothetical protein [Lewinellaceae bacterium]
MEQGFKTRDELAKELNISYSTLRRKVKKAGISIPKGLLSPETQSKIKHALGLKNRIFPTNFFQNTSDRF